VVDTKLLGVQGSRPVWTGCEHSHLACLSPRRGEAFRRFACVRDRLHPVHSPFTGAAQAASGKTYEKGPEIVRPPPFILRNRFNARLRQRHRLPPHGNRRHAGRLPGLPAMCRRHGCPSRRPVTCTLDMSRQPAVNPGVFSKARSPSSCRSPNPPSEPVFIRQTADAVAAQTSCKHAVTAVNATESPERRGDAR
jgi:hypothetical protein